MRFNPTTSSGTPAPSHNTPSTAPDTARPFAAVWGNNGGTAPMEIAEPIDYDTQDLAAGVNYAIFVAIMLIWPDTLPLMALVVASLAAMVVSYIGMRFGAFRVHSAPRF